MAEGRIWGWHKQALGVPSYAGVMLCILAPLGGNYWFWYPLMTLVLFGYMKLYDLFFESKADYWSVRGMLSGVTLITFQLVFWGALFFHVSKGS